MSKFLAQVHERFLTIANAKFVAFTHSPVKAFFLVINVTLANICSFCHRKTVVFDAKILEQFSTSRPFFDNNCMKSNPAHVVFFFEDAPHISILVKDL